MMPYFRLSGLVLAMFVLAGCSLSSQTDTSSDKTPYYIQVQSLSELKQSLQLKKSGVLLGASNLMMSAQIPGRVSQIPVQIGSQVTKGQVLVKLQDYGGTYVINASRAANAIKGAKINYSSTLTSLDKQTQDAQLALEDSRFKLEKIQSDIQAQQDKMQLDRNNAQISQSGSSANLQLQQLQAQLEKSRFDLEAKKQADRQTLDNFTNTYQVLIRDLNLLYENVIDEVDKILGSRIQTQALNDSFETYLGVRDTRSRINAENQMLQVINYQQTYNTLLNQSVNIEEMSSRLKSLIEGLQKLNKLLVSVNNLLANSVSSTVFPQSQLDAMVNVINSLQAQVQGQMSSITSQQNAIQSFLATYQSQQDSSQKALESLEQQYQYTSKNLSDGEILNDIAQQRQKISLEQALKGAQLGLQQAQNLNEISSRQKYNNLASVSNSIQGAQIAYQDAVNQLNKLTITSPIDGIVGDILVEVGQDIGMSTPVIRVYNNTKPQIEITLSKDELPMIKIGSVALIHIQDTILTGFITSIGSVSDANFMTKAIIDIPDTISNLGDVVDISIPVESDIVLIPLHVLTLLNSQLGQIILRNGSGTQTQEIDLGMVYGDLVELKTPLSDNLQIITSSLDTFNEQEQVLSIKQ